MGSFYHSISYIGVNLNDSWRIALRTYLIPKNMATTRTFQEVSINSLLVVIRGVQKPPDLVSVLVDGATSSGCVLRVPSPAVCRSIWASRRSDPFGLLPTIRSMQCLVSQNHTSNHPESTWPSGYLKHPSATAPPRPPHALHRVSSSSLGLQECFHVGGSSEAWCNKLAPRVNSRDAKRGDEQP